MIPKKDLVHGRYYYGTCRNANFARWCGHTERFYLWRLKFGGQFVEELPHPEDEAVADVFVPKTRAIVRMTIPLPKKLDKK